MPRASQSRECVSHLLTFTVCGVCPIGHARRGSTESASHRRLRVCSAAALRGALLAHAAWCATRTRLWLVSCYSPIAREQLVTMKRSPCVLCSSLFGNSLYAGLTLRARATRGLRRPTSGYRPFVGRLYGPLYVERALPNLLSTDPRGAVWQAFA